MERKAMSFRGFWLGVLGLALHPAQAVLARVTQFRGGTPSSRRGTRNKEGEPRGYPGAKLARAARRQRLTLRHG